MKKYVEIIGPCSKYIDGKGWVTQIPEELLFAKGYVNLLELMSENNKNSNAKLNTNERHCDKYEEKEEQESGKIQRRRLNRNNK